MSPEERLLARLQEWAPRFQAGRIRPRVLLSPRRREGERFGTKLNSVGLSRVPAADPMSGIDHAGAVEGLAYGTSERLILASGRTVKRSWEWSQLSEVAVLPGYLGVLLRTEDDVADAVHRVDIPHDLLAPQPWATGAEWLKVEGCFAASQGRLDAWLAGLPARVLG